MIPPSPRAFLPATANKIPLHAIAHGSRTRHPLGLALCMMA
jgi:hypothetical protein